MTTRTWIDDTLLTLQKSVKTLRNEKGNICVSLIVPTRRTSPDRRTDQLNTKKAIEKAERLMSTKYPTDIVSFFTNRLHELFLQIDFDHNEEGLGLFVSSNIQLQVSFPFPVKEKIVVGDSFEIRDVLYKENFSDPYYVLLLTEQGARLFYGSLNLLEKIIDKHFPLIYEDEYIYNPPSRTTSYAGQAHVKSFEKDKSELEAIRHSRFFHRVDTILNEYLLNTPLIVLGVEKNLALYEKVSRHQKNLAGKITGNYSHHNLKQLSDLVLPVIFGYQQNKRINLIEEFREQHTGGKAGIQNVWKAAMEGSAFKVLIEKDYSCAGFLDADKKHIYLESPQKAYTKLTDAVDDLIELVLEKEGNVYFVENGLLKDYGRIAMMARY
ncbi:MAG: baeRF3 domain-containing protein [Ginsengibacter sp.]